MRRRPGREPRPGTHGRLAPQSLQARNCFRIASYWSIPSRNCSTRGRRTGGRRVCRDAFPLARDPITEGQELALQLARVQLVQALEIGDRLVGASLDQLGDLGVVGGVDRAEHGRGGPSSRWRHRRAGRRRGGCGGDRDGSRVRRRRGTRCRGAARQQEYSQHCRSHRSISSPRSARDASVGRSRPAPYTEGRRTWCRNVRGLRRQTARARFPRGPLTSIKERSATSQRVGWRNPRARTAKPHRAKR